LYISQKICSNTQIEALQVQNPKQKKKKTQSDTCASDYNITRANLFGSAGRQSNDAGWYSDNEQG